MCFFFNVSPLFCLSCMLAMVTCFWWSSHAEKKSIQNTDPEMCQSEWQMIEVQLGPTRAPLNSQLNSTVVVVFFSPHFSEIKDRICAAYGVFLPKWQKGMPNINRFCYCEQEIKLEGTLHLTFPYSLWLRLLCPDRMPGCNTALLLAKVLFISHCKLLTLDSGSRCRNWLFVYEHH